MRIVSIIAVMAIANCLAGCVVVETAADVTGSVISTTADVTGSVVGGAARTVTGGSSDDERR
jgi:hypothetical protein